VCFSPKEEGTITTKRYVFQRQEEEMLIFTTEKVRVRPRGLEPYEGKRPKARESLRLSRARWRCNSRVNEEI